MRESYIVKNDNLKGYYNSFTNERSIYTHGTRKTFSNGYLYSCSDSVITSMKNKLNEKYNAIDKGYQAIDKWLADYIDDFNNIENSLKTGSVISNDSSTRAQLQKVQNKNDAKVLNATDIVYNIKNNKQIILNETLEIIKYILLNFSIFSYASNAPNTQLAPNKTNIKDIKICLIK